MFAAISSSGGFDSGSIPCMSTWKNWGGVLANTHACGDRDEALIIVDGEKTSSSSGISGTLKLIRDISRHGLLIEVQGFYPQITKDSGCSSVEKNPSESTNSDHLPGGKKSLTIITPAFKEYSFTLQLPEDTFPPGYNGRHPDKVEYVIRLYKEVDSIYSLLFEERFEISGLQLHSSRDLVEEQICISGIKLKIQLPKRTFGPGQNIPFTLKLVNPSKGSVKKVTLILWNMVKHQDEEEGSNDESGGALVSSVLGTLTFNNFPKGQSCREGHFDMEKVQGADKSRSKYVIQVNVRTTNSESFSTQLDLSIDDPDAPIQAKPKKITPIPPEIGNLVPPPSGQHVESTLSLQPPGYSVLSSRASSTLSLETLPPHYEDVWY